MVFLTLNNGLGSFNPGPGVVSPVVTTPPRVSRQVACRMAPLPLNNGLRSFHPGPGVVSPVVTTPHRVSGQDALKHVLDHVLCLPNNSGIRHSLKAGGYEKISQVLGMSEATKTASYEAHEQETLRTLKGFAHFHGKRIGHTLTPSDWCAVTADMFGAYQRQRLPWGGWQPHSMHTHYHGVRRTVRVPSLETRLAQQVHESYPDSSMGSSHDDADHPVMTSSPEVLVEDSMTSSPEAIVKDMMSSPEVVLEENSAPSMDQLQNMMPPNCAHGESQQNTSSHVAKLEKTPSVTICDPTHYALLSERKFGESLVDHRVNGGLAGTDMGVIQPPNPYVVHVEEGLDKHQASDVPMPTNSSVCLTKDGEVTGSTLSNVTTWARDWDLSVLDCDPHDVLQASDDTDATEELTVHDHFNQYGECMDENVATPVGKDDPALEEKVLPSTIKFKHMNIVEESDVAFLKEENKQDIYKYIVVYVDDLAMAILRPAEFTQLIIDKYKQFKLSDTSPTSFYLGHDLVTNKEDEEGILCLKPLKQMYGEKPSIKVTSIVEKKKHLELGDLGLCDMDEIKQYQCVVGFFKWTVSLARIDITRAVMTLSHLRPMPRKGHLLVCTKGVVAYLKKMCNDTGTHVTRTYEPDDPGISLVGHDWTTSINGEIPVLVPSNVPSPKDKTVILTSNVDSVLYHDWITGHSVMGIQHPINGTTPIDWFSKHQSTVEMTTYGSEFIAACNCVGQVIDVNNMTFYLGVPAHGTTLMFGDIKPVVNSLAQPHAKWHKRHTELSSHLVRGAIMTEDNKVLYHIPREDMSWGYQQVWQLLKPPMIWQGDTSMDVAKHSPSLAMD